MLRLSRSIPTHSLLFHPRPTLVPRVVLILSERVKLAACSSVMSLEEAHRKTVKGRGGVGAMLMDLCHVPSLRYYRGAVSRECAPRPFIADGVGGGSRSLWRTVDVVVVVDDDDCRWESSDNGVAGWRARACKVNLRAARLDI